MPVNTKKSIRLKNRTKYFIPGKDKTFVTFSSPYSYQSRSIKIEGYETRLYWQFRYCEENNGQTFFFTLTYNDAHLPVHYGVNCFDYEDLEDFLYGNLRKVLWRQYGTRFKFFVGAELGDGKGERGMHNNPHYHILFFLEPCPESELYWHYEYNDVPVGVYQRNTKDHKKGETKYKTVRKKVVSPYVPITPGEFRHLIRIYWQGFDEDEGKQDYQTCKYGIVKEGDNIGKVTDFRAISYVAKYVCKDIKLKMAESKVESYVRITNVKNLYWKHEFYRSYYDEVIKPMFNIPTNASQTAWCHTDAKLMKLLTGYKILPETVFGEYDGHTDPDDVDYIEFVKEVNKKYNLWKTFTEFRKNYINDKVHLAITEWRNRFCNKCRISQAVGDYALNFIGDKLDPRFEVPGKDGMKQRPMPMYYYRKLYTTVIHPEEKTFFGTTIKYPSIRVLNEDGINYKCYRLGKQMNKKAFDAKNNIRLVLNDPDLYEKMKKSDVNTEVFYSYQRFFEKWNYLLNENDNNNELFERYAEYKLIYEDRYFSIQGNGSADGYGMPLISPYADYRRFLVPSIYSTHRSDLRLDTFLNDPDETYLPYAEHPYFLPYIGIFNMLDLCADYFFITKDNRSQKQAEQIAETKRFHTERNLREFYKQFGL